MSGTVTVAIMTINVCGKNVQIYYHEDNVRRFLPITATTGCIKINSLLCSCSLLDTQVTGDRLMLKSEGDDLVKKPIQFGIKTFCF